MNPVKKQKTKYFGKTDRVFITCQADGIGNHRYIDSIILILLSILVYLPVLLIFAFMIITVFAMMFPLFHQGGGLS